MALNTLIGEDGESPYYKRHKVHFKGEKIPFGARVRFLPSKTSLHFRNKDKFDRENENYRFQLGSWIR